MHRVSLALVVITALLAAAWAAVGATSGTQAAFPGENGLITFRRNASIYVMAADGTNEREIRPGAYPKVSPDGEWIVFTETDGPDSNIFVMRTDGSSVTQLTTSPRPDFRPAWAPDGRHIAYLHIPSSSGEEFAHVMVMSLSDPMGPGQIRELVGPPFYPYYESSPAWSPDGSQLLIAGLEPGSDVEGLYVADAETGDLERLITGQDVLREHPAWSPDGQRIVFSQCCDGGRQLWVANADGSGTHAITEDYGSEPAWSPDGSKIIFTDDLGTFGLAMVNPDGGNLQHFTDNASSADWQPRPGVVHSVEFTQAIQDWQALAELKTDLEDDGEPPVPIVAGKPAAMRVYFHEIEQSISYDVEVSGVVQDELRVNLDRECTPQLRREREESCRSVDFFFTPPTGDWSVTLEVKEPGGETIESHTFDLRSVSTSPITVVPIDVCDHQSIPLVGSWDCAYGFQLYALAPYLHSTFPGQIQFAAAGGQVKEHTSNGDRGWWREALSEIDDLRSSAGANNLTFYHGAVREAAPSVDGILGLGYRPGYAAQTKLGEFYSDSNMMHELSHNFGREHVASFGESCLGEPAHADPNWPGTSPWIDEVGFSVVADVVLLTDEVKDYMSYCQPTWVSMYTYLGILERFRVAGPASAQSESVSGDFWLVSGQIDGGSANLGAVELEATSPAGEGNGDYRIEARAEGGSVLVTRRFDAAEGEWEGGTTAPTFSVMVPVVDGAARLVLIGPGEAELGEVAFQGSAPSVSITGPGSAQPLDEVQTLQWEVTDPDGGAHTSWVEYSTDGGATWEMLTPHIDGTSLVVNTAEIAGSANAMFRVLVSDGANTGSAVAGPFTVPEKAPQAQITAPASGAFRGGQLVWLQAVALDEEDGFLGGGAVTWASSRDGALGVGAQVHVYDLSVGTHTITMTARDSDDNVVTDTITVSVSDAPITEGEQPGEERTWGDSNCSGAADPVDALLALRFDAGQTTNTGDCPALGQAVQVAGESYAWGDVDCSGVVDPIDGLKLLRHDSGLGVSQEPGCPGIGTPVTVAQVAALPSWWRRLL